GSRWTTAERMNLPGEYRVPMAANNRRAATWPVRGRWNARHGRTAGRAAAGRSPGLHRAGGAQADSADRIGQRVLVAVRLPARRGRSDQRFGERADDAGSGHFNVLRRKITTGD